MRINSIGFTAIFFIAISCKSSVYKDLPIKGEKLINVLTDAYIAESAMQSLTEGLKDSLGRIYYQQLFEIHQISSADFENTIQMLETDPKLLDKLYSKVQEKFVLMEQRTY